MSRYDHYAERARKVLFGLGKLGGEATPGQISGELIRIGMGMDTRAVRQTLAWMENLPGPVVTREPGTGKGSGNAGVWKIGKKGREMLEGGKK